VFIDEADQALGKRDNNANDGGLSGRIYKMMAEEMSDPGTRGQILWVLATSRPDLVEVDLKRPGRIDVKFVLMPTGKSAEAAKLLRALMKRVDLSISDEETAALLPLMPEWLTPGAAEAITSDLYTEMSEARAQNRTTTVAAELRRILENYQPPVHLSIMETQIRIAVNEATKMTLVPEEFRRFRDA
jgi:SpoVK/Ycf46/Vps4 family AAA+-type ATPase